MPITLVPELIRQFVGAATKSKSFLMRCTVAVLERGIIRLKSNQDISAATFLLP